MNGVSAQFIGAQLMGAVTMTVVIYQVSRNLFFHPLQRVFLSPENFLMLLLCKKSGNEPSSLGRCLAGGSRRLLRASRCGRCSPFTERTVCRGKLGQVHQQRLRVSAKGPQTSPGRAGTTWTRGNRMTQVANPDCDRQRQAPQSYWLRAVMVLNGENECI